MDTPLNGKWCSRLRTVKQWHGTQRGNNIKRRFITTMLSFRQPKRFTGFFKLFVGNTLAFAAGNFGHVALHAKTVHSPNVIPSSQLQWLQPPYKSRPPPDPPGIRCSLNWWQGEDKGHSSWGSAKTAASYYVGFMAWRGGQRCGPIGPWELQI